MGSSGQPRQPPSRAAAEGKAAAGGNGPGTRGFRAEGGGRRGRHNTCFANGEVGRGGLEAALTPPPVPAVCLAYPCSGKGPRCMLRSQFPRPEWLASLSVAGVGLPGLDYVGGGLVPPAVLRAAPGALPARTLFAGPRIPREGVWNAAGAGRSAAPRATSRFLPALPPTRLSFQGPCKTH